MKENTMWVEAFRPKTLDGYIGNEQLIEKVKIFIESGDVPHLLFYGPAGTGKTTLAKIIANNIDADFMYINASSENSVDTVRDKISRYAATVGWGKNGKIIVLDEADFMTPNGQAALRNVMEQFSAGCRFILTCNYVEKIIDPIQSRCQVFGITPPDKPTVAKRLITILQAKGIEFTPVDVATIINNSYPDVRRAINQTQGSIIDGKLVVSKASTIQANYMTELLHILTSKGNPKSNFTNIRQIIADSKVRDFQPLYEFLYEKVDEYAEGHVAQIILIIAEAQFMDVSVVDKEINVMAMFVKILGEL